MIRNHAHAMPARPSLLKNSYFVLVFLSLFLPVSTIQAVPIYDLFFYWTILLFVLYASSRPLPAPAVTLLLISALFLVTWLWIGATRQTESIHYAFRAFSLYGVTFSLAYLSYFLYAGKVISFQEFVRVFLYSNLVVCVVKSLIIISVWVGYLTLADVVEFFSEKLGAGLVFYRISDNLVRLHNVNDIATPFAIFLWLVSNRIGLHIRRWTKLLVMPILLFSIFVIFSRYLWMVAAVGVLFSVLNRRFFMSAFSLFVLVVLVIVALGPFVGEPVTDRFFSDRSHLGDSMRQRQVVVVLEEAKNYPLFGKGIGAYARELPRHETLRFSYEVQWIGFLLQFGAVGLSILLFHVGMIARNFVAGRVSMLKIAFFTMFLLWLGAGWFNPYLISKTAGVIFSLFVLAGLDLKEHEAHSATGGKGLRTVRP